MDFNFVEKDLLPGIGKPMSTAEISNKAIITHEVEGIYWIINHFIGIHYETKEQEIKVCLRLGGDDVTCEVLTPDRSSCTLVGDLWVAKASIDLKMDMAACALSYSGVVCIKAIWKGMKWQCLPKVSGTIIQWN
jgi:hypothetical protein